MSEPAVMVSPRRRREVLDALRRGTVPANGLDLLAVGLDRIEPGFSVDLETVLSGGSAFRRFGASTRRDAGHPGLLLVLDEVETLQRVRSDARAKVLNALRQLIDEIDSGRFPGLYLLVTGTPAFFEGRQGIQLLPPLPNGCTPTSRQRRVSTIRVHRRFG